MNRDAFRQFMRALIADYMMKVGATIGVLRAKIDDDEAFAKIADALGLPPDSPAPESPASQTRTPTPKVAGRS